jgi:hypothetical protein
LPPAPCGSAGRARIDYIIIEKIAHKLKKTDTAPPRDILRPAPSEFWAAAEKPARESKGWNGLEGWNSALRQAAAWIWCWNWTAAR